MTRQCPECSKHRRRWLTKRSRVPSSLLVKLMAVASYAEMFVMEAPETELRAVAFKELCSWLRDPEVVACLRPEIRQKVVRDGVRWMPEPGGGSPQDAGSSQAA